VTQKQPQTCLSRHFHPRSHSHSNPPDGCGTCCARVSSGLNAAPQREKITTVKPLTGGLLAGAVPDEPQ
jgi:hypothetical protein